MVQIIVSKHSNAIILVNNKSFQPTGEDAPTLPPTPLKNPLHDCPESCFDSLSEKLRSEHKLPENCMEKTVREHGLQGFQILDDGEILRVEATDTEYLRFLKLGYTNLLYTAEANKNKWDYAHAEMHIKRQITGIEKLVDKVDRGESKTREEVEFQSTLFEERNLAWVRAVLREHIDCFEIVQVAADRMDVD